VTAPGLTVMAMILFMGAVPVHGCRSGAHFNPVVSVGFAMRGDFPWKRVPGYLVAQLIGSILAVLFLSRDASATSEVSARPSRVPASPRHGADLRGGADP